VEAKAWNRSEGSAPAVRLGGDKQPDPPPGRHAVAIALIAFAIVFAFYSLADSNADWGQALKPLRVWMKDHGMQPIDWSIGSTNSGGRQKKGAPAVASAPFDRVRPV